jgi:hypothetical protein
MNNDELPKLPDGWSWKVDDLNSPRAIHINASVAFSNGKISIVIPEPSDWILINADTIIAVLKANGVL